MKKLDFSTKVILILVNIGVLIYVLNFLFLSALPLTIISIGIVVAGPSIFEYKRFNEN